MQDFQSKRILSSHLWVIYSLSVILLGFVWFFHWIIGLVLTILLGASLYFSIFAEKKRRQDTENYIATLSHRVKRVGEEALLEMPIGIILFNEDYNIEWANPYMNRLTEDDTLVGKSLNMLSDDFVSKVKENDNEIWLDLEGYHFQVSIKKDERLLYLSDRTVQSEIQSRYVNEKIVLAIIFLDNYEEITQNMDDTLKSQLNSKVTSVLNNWSNDYGIYMKRSSDRKSVV